MNVKRVAAVFIGSEIAVAALFGVVGATGNLHGTAYASPANECQYEDGNTDGRPCSWQDPDSGRWYSVSSEDYR